MTNIIRFNNVSKKIGDKFLVQNINFDVRQGTITTLIGPNGAGKTTIAKMMLSLQSPSTGEIKILPNLKIGYVPQKLEFNHTLPIDVKSFIKLMAPNFQRDRLISFAEFFDFDELQNRDITTISGGQFQKLMIVSNLLSRPDLLIFDEPTQFLDILSQNSFYSLIENMRKDEGLTVFMISHDLFTVMKNSDQVICLNRHICCSGKPSEMRSDQSFIDALSSLGFYTHDHDHKH